MEETNPIKELYHKLQEFRKVKTATPKHGWIREIRKTLNMPTDHIAKLIGKSPQSVIEFEKGEANKTITLKSLEKIAKALDMELVYGFVPKDPDAYTNLKTELGRRMLWGEYMGNTTAAMRRGNGGVIIFEKMKQKNLRNFPKAFWKKKK
ncbi:MAG: helix-turn-helix domain-containing protein [Bacteroidota bacterium]